MAQLLPYNSSIRRRGGSTGVYHSKVRVTSLPIYVGISVHAKTRKRGLIDTLFDLGLSISYDRVMELSTAMANHVCEQYHCNKVVCPLNLLRGLFTTAALKILIITTAQHLLQNLSMALGYHYSSIQAPAIKVMIGGSILSLNDHPQTIYH